ncbi:MAG: hypothetical protein KBA66_05575 [Leptospiraceae bacterium]|nr:hypothetical protein [Leptospiraceae bacterium]
MNNRILKILSLLFAIITFFECSLFQKEKEDKNKNLLLLAAVASSNSGNREMYAGFADIPASIYQTTSSGSASIQSSSRTLATTDYRFRNSTNTASVANVYDLVRAAAKSTRSITITIGTLVSLLETLNVSVSDTAITGNSFWALHLSKFSYKKSSKLTDGKLLEIWWNSPIAPYNNNKAMELNYTGSTSGGNISGYLWVRFLAYPGASSLSTAYINFSYNASTNTRTMIVILQDVGTSNSDKAHFFVQEVNGVTTMDGGYYVSDFNPNIVGVNASNRVYVFNAAGNANYAVVNAAFPLSSDTTTAIYGNTTLGNIGQVWTNFILANSTTVSTLNGIGLPACDSSNITSTSSDNGNPTSLIASISVSNMKACLDAIITAQGSTNAVKDVYFITNIKNPAYFTYFGNMASLYGVQSLDSSDANKATFDALYSQLATSARTTSDGTYAAGLDANTISTINIVTGVGIPVGSTANTLPSFNAQWGDGSAGTNSVNGSSNNSAPF